MTYKPKKVGEKNKKEKDPNKFHLGRNAGTALILGGVILFLVLVYTVLWATVIGSSSYLKVYNKNKVTPYKESHPEAKLVEASKFKDFDVNFYCTSFSSKDEHKAVFKILLTSTEATEELTPITSSLSTNKTSTSSNPTVVIAEVCLAANWVNVEKYSSTITIEKNSLTRKDDEDKKTTSKTATVSLDKTQVFPMKKDLWPVDVKVNAPDAYLFLAYYTEKNGKDILNQYILHYTYNQYTKNDYANFGITSPAI